MRGSPATRVFLDLRSEMSAHTPMKSATCLFFFISDPSVSPFLMRPEYILEIRFVCFTYASFDTLKEG